MNTFNDLTDQEKFVSRVLAKEDLYYFSRYMFLARRNFPWMRSDHHQVICDALMRVYRGETKRLIINVPPRYSKTELAVVNFMAFALGKHPDAEFIHASYSGTLASNNAANAREMIRHEEYQQIFPGVVIRTDSNAKADWRTDKGGVVYASGAKGTITGFGAGKVRPGFGGAIIIDDPHKPDEASSDPIRTGVIEWFQNTLESRKNTPDTPIIVIMQRLHEEDLAGWLLAGGNGEQWEHVCLEALIDEDLPTERALWPAKHTVVDLKRLKKTNQYVFSGQYQQAPSPKGGSIIRGEWFQRYKVVPPLKWRAAYVDTAQKAKQHNDYTVFLHAGMGHDGKVYLLDCVRDKYEAVKLEQTAKDLWAKWKIPGPYLGAAYRYFAIEDKASGTGLIQQLKTRHTIPVKPLQRLAGQDKYSRVMDVQGHLESGFVMLPETAGWVSDFIAECEAFTANDTHKHDDQVDTLADCAADMLNGKTSMLDIL